MISVSTPFLGSLRRDFLIALTIIYFMLAGLFFMHALAGAYCALLFGLSVILHNRRSFGAVPFLFA